MLSITLKCCRQLHQQWKQCHIKTILFTFYTLHCNFNQSYGWTFKQDLIFQTFSEYVLNVLRIYWVAFHLKYMLVYYHKTRCLRSTCLVCFPWQNCIAFYRYALINIKSIRMSRNLFICLCCCFFLNFAHQIKTSYYIHAELKQLR